MPEERSTISSPLLTTPKVKACEPTVAVPSAVPVKPPSDVFGLLAAHHAMRDRAHVQLPANALGKIVQRRRVQLFSYQAGELAAQAGADLGLIFARQLHALHGITHIDVFILIWTIGQQQAAPQQAAEPGESHARKDSRWLAKSKFME
jgi:hypothetical protein